MQFNMSHPVDIVLNTIVDLLKISEYALMPNSSSKAFNLAYVVFERNPILLQDLWAWNPHSAEFCTWDAMKIHICKAQCDLLSLPVAGHMCNQKLHQGNLVQLPGSILYNGAPPTIQQLLHNSRPNRHNILFQCFQNEPCWTYSNGNQSTAACS